MFNSKISQDNLAETELVQGTEIGFTELDDNTAMSIKGGHNLTDGLADDLYGNYSEWWNDFSNQWWEGFREATLKGNSHDHHHHHHYNHGDWYDY